MAMTDEAGKTFSSCPFIVPNEDHYSEFATGNRKRKGAFIGVGTFRVLVGASYGYFEEVIFADLDRRVVEFNRFQIDALKMSPTVEEFLIHLKSLQSSNLEILEPRTLMSAYVQRLERYKKSDTSGSFPVNPKAYNHLRMLALSGRMHSVSASLTGSVTLSSIAGLHLRHLTNECVERVPSARAEICFVRSCD